MIWNNKGAVQEEIIERLNKCKKVSKPVNQVEK